MSASRKSRARGRSALLSPGAPLGKALILAACALAMLATGRSDSTTKVKDFSVPEYYDPPNERQMKTLLQGAEAEPEPEGLIRIQRMKLQRFSEDGRLEMTAQAPHCIFDSVRREVHSPGPLEVKYADGKVNLQGEGFLWQQTNSTLIVSNLVHTTIHNASNKSPNP